jgi:ABC-2 type transport system ATP-binding protein
LRDLVLTADRLTKQFGTVHAVQELTLSLSAGEAVALLGPNGSGKTTAFKLFMGLYRPTSGSAQIMGFDVSRSPDEVRRFVGYSPDEPGFHGFLTGAETLDFVIAVRGLERDRAWDELKPLVDGLQFDSLLNTFVHGYSLGAKKKLALLSALVHRPPLLLLDEPTNGLDPESVVFIRETLRQRVADGTALLLSTHHLELAAALTTRAILIRRGSVALDGSVEAARAIIDPPIGHADGA